MPGGWVKALQCKTNAIEDVYHQPPLKPPLPSTPRKQSFSSPSSTTTTSPSKTNKPPLLPLGCGNTSHHLKDIIILKKQSKPKSTTKPKSTKSKSQPLPSPPLQPSFPSQPKPRPKPKSQNLSSLPTLLPLPPNHSSRRVVEIIFTSSWSSPATPSPTFSGEIEMLFKIHNPPRTISRFEEYRDQVRFRAGPGSSRCAADGNEMMRFRPAPASFDSGISGEPTCYAGVVWPVGGDGGIRTFAGSGGAHGGGAGKRRAMVICRVIAGRVWTGFGSGPNPVDYESVSVRKGELLVFDPRAVLPCFLIIYKI